LIEEAAMPNQLGPIEISCDAPPYHIVRACHIIGIQTPEDVRWCRISHVLSASLGLRDLLKLQPWKVFSVVNQPGQGTCSCRQPLPTLERYTFTLITGHEVSYLLGQCSRCRTVYWEEA
jgi:hypothetical protein